MTVQTAPSKVPDLLGTAPADLALPAGRQASPEEARSRADRIREGLASYVAMRQDIADAFGMEDWRPLGYASWFAYVEFEFGEALKGLARGERREAVADLRAQGMSTRQIASATGVSHPQVIKDLKAGGNSVTTSEPAKVIGSDGKSYPASRPVPEPAPEPLAKVAEAIERELPPDPEPWSGWRVAYLREIAGAHNLLSRQTPEEVAERADHDCVIALRRFVRQANDYLARVDRALAELLPDNVSPLRRAE